MSDIPFEVGEEDVLTYDLSDEQSGHQYSNYCDDGFYDLRGLTLG